ncbi:MAG: nucleoside triphosphate pyrophosphohydrolase [Coriobacteriia bacterium]|nr:nucleoside triphosphate pyrophosphohydrolase [Coriobacteriia bacterium]
MGEGTTNPSIGERFEQFASTIARLRAPGGCPWDAEQTHASIARNMIEEAHEAVDAIRTDDMAALREELGDVLLQVVFQTQMATEAGEFDLSDVIEDINNKMIRRHPHVFGDDAAFAAAHFSPERIAQIKSAQTAGQVLDLWDQIKLQEKEEKAARRSAQDAQDAQGSQDTQGKKLISLLDNVPRSLPALMQAQDISRKAVSAGFEWEDVASIWRQVALEIEEFKAEAQGSQAAAEEFGDVLFSLVNVARREGIDAETALLAACDKFRVRWAIMEQYACDGGGSIESYSVEQQEAWWQAAKLQEKE